jgi:membrane protease subunit HflC
MKKNVGILVAVVGVVVVVFLLFTCLFTHKDYEEPIVTRFGAPVEPLSLGVGNLKAKLPTPIDTVQWIDLRVRSFRTGNNAEFNLAAAREGLAGTEKLIIQMFCHWQVTDALQYFRRFAADASKAEKRLGEKLVDMLRGECQGRTINDFFNLIEDRVKQRDMEVRIRDAVNAECAQEQLGVRVAGVGFYRISFPPTVFESICNAMVAEQTQRATSFEKEGEEEAARIRARAQREADGYKSDAAAEAELIRKRAEAEAEAIYRSAISRSPELYRFLEGLKAAKAAMDKDTQVVLSVEDWEMLRALMDPDSFGESPATRPAAP